jgi:hypothetical protein
MTRRDRTALVEGLKERGYNAALILEDSWDDEGYRMLVLDSRGRKLRNGLGGIATVWQLWDDPEHYEFVRDWYQERF